MWASTARVLSDQLSSLPSRLSTRRSSSRRSKVPYYPVDHWAPLVPQISPLASSSLCLASAAASLVALTTTTSSTVLCEEVPDKKARLGIQDAERYISSVVPHRPHSAGSSFDVVQRGGTDVLK